MMGQNILVVGLWMICAGGMFYAFAYPHLSGDAKRQKRQEALKTPVQKRALDRTVDQAKRRQQIADSLKEVDGTTRKRKRTIEDRLKYAGLSASKRKFYLASAACGLLLGAFVFIGKGDPVFALGACFVGAFGLPRWILNHLGKRRVRKFTDDFPNAVDVIIRGVKAGLPLAHCVQIIAAEFADPVRAEFRRIVEGQAVGLTMPEAVERLPDSMPIPEANFFAIVIALQNKSGGNLSEALGNLSRVLRDRKKMRLKIKAMSAEAKASASIIAALPFLVTFFVWLTTPDYISMLWTENTGRIVLMAAAFWMATGVFVMRKLINFDF